MADTMLNQYTPDYLVTPGEVLVEYLEGYSMTQTELAARTGRRKEEEADVFARDRLIPPADYRRFIASWDGRSLAPIKVFAERIKIAPGIVVGRLQHDKHLPNSHGNKLKVYFCWSD